MLEKFNIASFFLFCYLSSLNIGLTPPGLTTQMPVGQMSIGQGSSTRGPRAICGPRVSFVRPGKGISQNTMRYEYSKLESLYTK